ncbi:MAG: MinD/ParA family protein [Methylococcaceae bacterium]|nr:MAG: MinD/ParA family protein [Methylococcaceae bacterium]
MAQLKPVRALAVTSGKGGVGKSNVSINLGIALRAMGRQVLLLDADMSLANVDVLLGLQPRYNLSHVLSGERTLEEILVEAPGGLKLIPAASGIQRMSELSGAEQAGIIRAFSEFNQDFDFLVVDTAAGISSSVVNFARACQDIVVVLCDEPTSLTDAYAFIKLLNRDYSIYRFQIVANMVQNAAQAQALFVKLCRVTDRYLDVTLNLLGAIPHDNFLRKAVQKQTAVIQAFPQSPSAQAFHQLARRVDNMPLGREHGGQLAFFVERMIQASMGQAF